MFEVDLTAEVVCHIYSSKKSKVGYFFLAPWEKKKIKMTNLSSSCEGLKDKNFWVGDNFNPFSSVARAQSVPINYNVSVSSLLRIFIFSFSIFFIASS